MKTFYWFRVCRDLGIILYSLLFLRQFSRLYLYSLTLSPSSSPWLLPLLELAPCLMITITYPILPASLYPPNSFSTPWSEAILSSASQVESFCQWLFTQIKSHIFVKTFRVLPSSLPASLYLDVCGSYTGPTTPVPGFLTGSQKHPLSTLFLLLGWQNSLSSLWCWLSVTFCHHPYHHFLFLCLF